MAKKQLEVAPTYPAATIRLHNLDMLCQVISSNETTARLRVSADGGIPQYLAFIRDGIVRRARVKSADKGPLGLDIWLELRAEQDKRLQSLKRAA